MHKPQTVLALKNNYGSITNWAHRHNFNVSGVNDIIHRRGYFATMQVPNNWTVAYRILQQLILDGFTEQITADGWNISLINITKIVVPTRLKITLEHNLEAICWDVCELGDEYTCNIFNSSTPEAGPLAILFMMEKNNQATRAACKFLNKKYATYMFYVESTDVITIWTKE